MTFSLNVLKKKTEKEKRRIGKKKTHSRFCFLKCKLQCVSMQELWGANQVDHFDFSQKGKQEEGGASCSLLRKCGMKGSWELRVAVTHREDAHTAFANSFKI